MASWCVVIETEVCAVEYIGCLLALREASFKNSSYILFSYPVYVSLCYVRINTGDPSTHVQVNGKGTVIFLLGSCSYHQPI